MLKNSSKNNNLTLIHEILPRIESKFLTLVRDVILILSFAVLTGVSAKLKIEIGQVPITGQTLVVLLSGVLLGSKKGAISQISYLLGGLSGLPWFSRGGGMGYILSPTFGYIIGFAMSAYLVGILVEKGWNRNIITTILTMLIGSIAIYIPGLLWLAKFVGLSKAAVIGLYPFILGDLLKIITAVSILSLSWKIIKK
jgi:biotin transporter BioY